MTLLECLVGLVILGTLLSSLLVARARYVHQAAVARRRALAIKAADALLAKWWGRAVPPVREEDGMVAGGQHLSWRTRLVPNAAVGVLGGRVLRLEVLDDRLPSREAVLVRVELVVPLAQAATAPGEGNGDGGS